ncbi:MAG: hypothetical protein HZB16_22860 [Armatimonadetes bacterium]|nr:hypothetical protein [Armatimonadota bacterium]
MPRGKRRFYEQAPTPNAARVLGGCGLLTVATIAMAVIASIGSGWLAALAAGVILAPLLAVVPSLLRGGTRAGVSIDDELLIEWYPLGWRRATPLATIERVGITDQGAMVYTSGRNIPLEPPLCDWLRVACACRLAIGAEVPASYLEDAALSLPTEEVEQWLGIERGGTLQLSSSFHRRAYPILQGLLVGSGLLSLLLTNINGMMALPAAAIFALSARAPRGRGRRVLEIQARGAELDVLTDEGWRRYAWGSFLSLGQRGLFWVIGTPQGDIWLPPGLPQLERLLRAVQSSIEARKRGWSMPRMTADVSEAAISLVREQSSEVERGISPVAQAEPPEPGI